MSDSASDYNDLCTFDSDGLCKRHRMKHEGRNYRLSQDRTQVGHHFRKQWDVMAQGGNREFTDVCVFNEDGVCVRHGFRHEGKAKEISQEVSERGHRIRKQWDEVMLKMRMAEKPKGCKCNEKKGKLH